MLEHLTHREKWAWVGGLFDGEGGVSLYHNSIKRRMYETNVQMSMVHKPTLEAFQEIVGGKIYGAYNYSGKHTREYWTWSCPTSQQAQLLMRICPFLVEKHERAQLLIRARQLIEEHKWAHKHTINHRKGSRVPYPEELATIRIELRRLNKRGV